MMKTKQVAPYNAAFYTDFEVEAETLTGNIVVWLLFTLGIYL